MKANELKQRAQRLANRLTQMGFTKDGKPLVIDQAFELVAAEEGFRNQHVLREKFRTGSDAAVPVLAKGIQEAGYAPATKEYPRLVIPRQLDEAFMGAVLVQHGPFDTTDSNFAFEAWDHIVEEAAKRAGLEIPLTRESEQAAERAWADVVNQQGWNNESEVIHLEGFIQQFGLMAELVKYATRVAAEENGDISQDVEGAGTVTCSVIGESADELSDAQIAFLERIGFEVKESDLHRPFWECGDTGSEDFDTEAEAWQDAYLVALETAADALGISMAAFTAQPEPEIMKALERFNPRTLVDMTEVLDRCGFEFVRASGKKWTWRHINDVFSKTTAGSSTQAVVQAWAYAKVKTGLPESIYELTPFEAQLVMLEAALTGKVANEVVSTLSSDEDPKALADAAFENYEFSSEVVEVNGWEWSSGTGVFRRAVFLAAPDGGDTRKVIFTVTVDGDQVNSYVSND